MILSDSKLAKVPMDARVYLFALLVASCAPLPNPPPSGTLSDGGVDGGIPVWVDPPYVPRLTWAIAPAPPPRTIRLGDHLIIGNRHRLLQVINTAAGQEPTIVGQIPLLGAPTRLLLRDEELFVLTGNERFCHGTPGPSTCGHGGRLLRFDVTDPAAPRLTGGAALDGYCLDLVVDSAFAVVGCIEIPSGRAIVQSVGLAAVQLAAVDRRALAGDQMARVSCMGRTCLATAAASRDDWADTLIESARTDPATGALLVSSIRVPGRLAAGDAITMRENLLRVWTNAADGRVQLHWLDEAALESLAVHTATFGPAGVRMAGDRAYLFPDPYSYPYSIGPSLTVLDASSSEALPLLGALSLPAPPGEAAGDARAFGDRVVLLVSSNEGLLLRILGAEGVGEPALVEGVTGYPEYPWPLSGPYSRTSPNILWQWNVHESGLVTIRYRSAYPASAGGVHVLRIDGDRLESLGHFPTRDWGQDAEILRGGALALYSDYALEVADLSSAPTWTPLVRHVRALAPAGDLLVQLAGYFLEEVELLVTPSDAPGTVTPLARVPLGAAEAWLWARGGRAYVLRQRTPGGSPAELLPVDLTTPRVPRLGRPLALSGFEEHCVFIESAPDHLACTDRWRPTARVELIDAARLEEPRTLAPIELPAGHRVNALRARGNVLEIVSEGEPSLESLSEPPRVLHRYDVRDPSAAALLSRHELSGYPLAWDGDTIFTVEHGFISEHGLETSILRRGRIEADGVRVTGELIVPAYPGFAATADLAVVSATFARATTPDFGEAPGELLVLGLSTPNDLPILSRTSTWYGAVTLAGRTLLVWGSNNVFAYRIDAQNELTYERLFAGEPLRVLERDGRVFVVAAGWIEEVAATP